MQNCVFWYQDSAPCFVYNPSNDLFPHRALSQASSQLGSPSGCRLHSPGRGSGAACRCYLTGSLLIAASTTFLFCSLCPPFTNHWRHPGTLCQASDMYMREGSKVRKTLPTRSLQSRENTRQAQKWPWGKVECDRPHKRYGQKSQRNHMWEGNRETTKGDLLSTFRDLLFFLAWIGFLSL